MKNSLFTMCAAAALLTASSAFAAPSAHQEGPRRPPVAQGPGYYGGPRFEGGYNRGPRPDDRRPDRYAERYDRDPHYGYEREQRLPPPPPPRRPVAVAIQIQL